MMNDDALSRVASGRIDPPEWTHEAADALWCRLVSEGRIVQRASDGTSGPYRVDVVIVEHPTLPAGEVYALYAMGLGSFTAYRCLPGDALEAVRDPSAFNL